MAGFMPFGTMPSLPAGIAPMSGFVTPITTSAVPGAVYQLSADTQFTSSNAFSSGMPNNIEPPTGFSTVLWKNNDARVSAIKNNDNTFSLYVSRGSGGHDVVDIRLTQLGLADDDKEYTITITGRTLPSTFTQMRDGGSGGDISQGNSAGDGTFTRTGTETGAQWLARSGQVVRIQASAPYYIIDTITVTRVEDSYVMYNMATDITATEVSGQYGLGGVAALTISSPKTTVVNAPNGMRALLMPSRSVDSHAVDVNASIVGSMDVSKKYDITITGYALGAPSGAQAVLGLSNNPWSEYASQNIGADGSFTISLIDFTFPGGTNLSGQGLRIKSNTDGANMPMLITEILIVDKDAGGGGPIEIPVRPWADILSDFFVQEVAGGGGNPSTVAATNNGINVTERTTNNQGLGINVAALRALHPNYPGTVPAIVITGSITGGTGPNWGPRFEVLPDANWGASQAAGTQGNETSVTIPSTSTFAPGLAHVLLTNGDGGNPVATSFTITHITVGGIPISPEPTAPFSWSEIRSMFFSASGGAHGSTTVTTETNGITISDIGVNAAGLGVNIAGLRALNENNKEIVIFATTTGTTGGRLEILANNDNWGQLHSNSLSFVRIPADNATVNAAGTNHRLIIGNGTYPAGINIVNITVGGVSIVQGGGRHPCTINVGSCSMGSAVVQTPATCTAAGTSMRTCTVPACDRYENVTVAALGHAFTRYNATYHRCNTCNITQAHYPINPGDDCATDGCDHTTPAAGFEHDCDDHWSATPVSTATCTTAGRNTWHCTFTNCTSSKWEVAPALGHTTSTGQCARCPASPCGMCNRMSEWHWGGNNDRHWSSNDCCDYNAACTFDANGRCTVCLRSPANPPTPCGMCGTVGIWRWGGNADIHYSAGSDCCRDYEPHTFDQNGVCRCGYVRPGGAYTACGICGVVGPWQWGSNADTHWAENCNCTGNAPHVFDANGVCICGATRAVDGTTYTPCGMCGTPGPWSWGGNADTHWAVGCSCTANAPHVFDANGVCICGATRVVAPQEAFRDEDFIDAEGLIDDLLAMIEAGEVPTIDLTDAGNLTIVSADVLLAIAEAGVDVVVVLPSGFTFTIIAASISADVGAFDLNIIVETVHLTMQRETLGGGLVDVADNSLVFLPNFHGDFGFDLVFNVTAEQLEYAGIDSATVMHFHVCAVGEVTEQDQPLLNADGSVSIRISHASFHVLSNEAPLTVETGTLVTVPEVSEPGGTEVTSPGGEQGGTLPPIQEILASQNNDTLWLLITISASVLIIAIGAVVIIKDRRSRAY
jgi:hypothetical protein